MDERSNRSPLRLVLATTVILAASSFERTQAAAITSDAQIVVSTINSLGPAWAAFLEGGTALWSLEAAPSFPSNLVLPTSNGVLVDTPFVDYLRWRRNIDPTRFDSYHPTVGPELAQTTTVTTSTSTVPHPSVTLPPPTVTVSKPHDTKTPPPPIPNPEAQKIPEPGMLPIAALLLAAGLGWHGRRSAVRR